MPSSMLITVPPTLLLLFIQHYGFPLRSQFRQIFRLCTLFAVVQLPAAAQNVSLSCLLYVVLEEQKGFHSCLRVTMLFMLVLCT
ncbi:hypothetical protein F5B21DRAFT_473490 [Xylaria acuta]|nr:hypothetical protein F5B21DRAFT_473490 [Xylaria acuta]